MSIENALLPRVWELERSLGQAVRVNYALRETIERQAAQIVMLRDALLEVKTIAECDEYPATTKFIKESLAATEDMKEQWK